LRGPVEGAKEKKIPWVPYGIETGETNTKNNKKE
jgi:hypothetical protein